MRVQLIHECIDRSSSKNPEHVAFRCLTDDLSYQDLADQSARLCHVLWNQGVRRGDRVGLFMYKNLNSAVAIYGILRAGGAYVPIDPNAPVARVATILRHCGIRHLVTHDAKLNDVRALGGYDTPLECVIGLSATEVPGFSHVTWNDVLSAPTNAHVERCFPDDVAYIMYTSGSTGLPKGITHTHTSCLAYATAITDLYGVMPSDRLGNHSPLHFDISIFDFVGGPLRGATTIIIPEPYIKVPVSLAKLMENERLTFWFSAPNALTQLLLRGEVSQRDLSSLRWVIFGGEPFPPKYLNALRALWPQAKFSNSYGPAETNMCSYFHVDDTIDADTNAIPIGRMWTIAEGLIVDENDAPVALGKPGELLVRSETVMRGYWNAPDLNSRCFFRRATGKGFDDLFYRTGDLVIDRGDNRMEFLGRKDRQIKVRGYRVELDEIEAVLAADAAVEEAAAFKSKDGEAIEAAVTLIEGSDVSSQFLIEICAKQLPPYAIPCHIRILQEFPRTATQKIDRRALSQSTSHIVN